MPGYSHKSLAGKLDLKPHHRILLDGAPADFRQLLAPLPEAARLVTPRARQADAAICFVTRATTLRDRFPLLSTKLPPAGILWVAWPKRAAKVETDLSENVVREIGLAGGLVDVKVCAITEVWSGLKFVRRLKDR